ncbi:MAG: protein kinase domain-containing protein [Limnospira sp.]
MTNEQIVGGRYRIIKCLGSGGFGRTFLATDDRNPTASPCVLKQFCPRSQHPEHLQKATELFELEAVRLENLGKHPQIARLIDYFKIEDSQYLVLEYIEGQNLRQILETRGRFNESQIRYLLGNLLPVLEFIHSHNIIHRDIKPENIIRSPNGQLVIVDFGAAKQAIGSALLQTGTLIGTPEYVAPEQLRGRATFASDLYSLGVTCLHLLTHLSPFDLFDTGEDRWVWRHYLTDRAVGDELGQILDRLTEEATNRRYPCAADVLRDLDTRRPRLNVIAQPAAFPPQPRHIGLGWKRPQTVSDYWSSVSCVALSPDGQILAGGSFDRTVRLWRPDTGEWIASFLTPSQPILAVAFSPDGRLLAGGSGDGKVHLWDWATRNEVGTIAAHGDGRVSVSAAFSPLGDAIATAGDDGIVHIWAIETGQLRRSLQHLRGINGLAYAPDGQLLATASSDNSVHLWRPDTGEHLGQLAGHRRDVNALAFSPDGRLLATASSDKTVKIWDLDRRELRHTLSEHQDWVRTVAFFPSLDRDRPPLLASGGADRTVKIWDLDRETVVDTLFGHSKDVNAIAVSPDGKILASGSSDNTLKIWRRE